MIDVFRQGWQSVDALFDEVLERPPDERTAFLRARCGNNPKLYHEILDLLAAEAEAEAVLGESATEFVAPLIPGLREELAVASSLPPGTAVGPYRIERLIGRGGMGNVYLAERADGAFRKRVALKLVRRGLDTDEVLARFRRERQLLASLEHPNIARLLDGGVADDGRPYLVMEYVDGETITAYCDTHRLTTEQRLSLFEQVCGAVLQAHRRLVVHRDLKPSNVLVTPEGEVKLLDFGIAKVLEGGLDEEPLVTRGEARLLTPEYAAPEQIRGTQVTTASDVYSLGVLLYELLVGRRPFEVAGMAPHERERVLLDAEPRPPGSMVTDEAATRRSTTGPSLRRRLRGDIEAIVLAALRKDPAQRYGSVEALLEDVRRHRSNLPIRVRRESGSYRTGRFVRRHRWGVGVVSAFLLLLSASVVALSLQQRATALERDRAELELAQKTEVTRFLTDLFGAADPAQSRGDTLTVFDLLDQGAQRIDELQDQPAVQGHLLFILSYVHAKLGNLPRALALGEQALSVRLAALGERHLGVAESENHLGNVHSDLGDYRAAEPHLRRALAIRRELLPSTDAFVAESVLNLGLLLTYTGQYDEGEVLVREALALDRARFGEQHADVATALNNLAVLLYFKGDYSGAEEAFREALDIRRAVYGDPHPRIATTMNNLAAILRRRGDLAGSEALFRESLEMTHRLVGDTHPDVAGTLSNLAAVIGEAGRPAEAAPLLRQAVAIGRGLYDRHPELADALGNLGRTLIELGQLDEAEAALREAATMNRETRGPEHPRVALTTHFLGIVSQARGDERRAEEQFRAALALQERVLPPEHDETAGTAAALGNLLARQGRLDEARPLLGRAHAALLATHGERDPRVQEAASRLALATAPTAPR
jgi:eukaryotic-like serine/threonine-protein kinase